VVDVKEKQPSEEPSVDQAEKQNEEPEKQNEEPEHQIRTEEQTLEQNRHSEFKLSSTQERLSTAE